MSEYVPVALRRKVTALAKEQCEYCLFPAQMTKRPHEPDHIIPIQHRGKTELINLALSCFLCNRHKGSNIASYDEFTGALTPFFNPRADSWTEHFELVDGRINPKTDVGRVTAHILAFNSDKQVEERKLAWALGLIVIP